MNAGEASKETPRKLKDFLHRRPAPKERQLPEDDYKVVIPPGGGLDLTRHSVALIKDGVLRAAKIQPDVAGEDTLRINMRQNTIIMSTPSLANAKNYSNIKEIQINGKSYATAAYIIATENTSKGVIHGIPTYDNQEDIQKSLVNQRNPTILHARRMGLTDSVVIVFEGSFVPYFVYTVVPNIGASSTRNNTKHALHAEELDIGRMFAHSPTARNVAVVEYSIQLTTTSVTHSATSTVKVILQEIRNAKNGSRPHIF